MNIIQTQLDEKVLSVFNNDGVVVNKKLFALSDRFHKLPRFVADYLISKLIDPNDTSPGLALIEKIMSENYVESDQRELIKSRIRENGVHSLLGQIRCRYDQGRDEYWADIGALGDQNIRIDPYIIAEYGEVLLTTGAWGTIEITFDGSMSIRSKKYPFIITKFVPFQITKIDLDDWINKRQYFETEEWIDLLITSIGFNPSAFTEEEKLLYLVRLVPFVEANLNLIELGSVETGKTFAYRSLSSYGFVLSGAKTTVASLFYNKLRKKPGIICHRDCVAFDEIGSANWTGQDDLVNMLKDFMNNGRFGRDAIEFGSDASVVFMGNIDCDRKQKEVKSFYRHLFIVLPSIINNDRAFLDRIHGYIPGWKVPQIVEANYAQSIGFIADYFSELMHQLRSRYYGHIIEEHVDFNGMSHRNQNSITKIGSGLLKLIYPHRTKETVQQNELKHVLDMAVDLRQRVVTQLCIISPGEFDKIRLSWRFKNN
jgi:ATP-dependent Lon protease